MVRLDTPGIGFAATIGSSAAVVHRPPLSVFMRALLSGLAAPVMAFREPPQYVVLPPGAGVADAWLNVSGHLTEAFGEPRR